MEGLVYSRGTRYTTKAFRVNMCATRKQSKVISTILQDGSSAMLWCRSSRCPCCGTTTTCVVNDTLLKYSTNLQTNTQKGADPLQAAALAGAIITVGNDISLLSWNTPATVHNSNTEEPIGHFQWRPALHALTFKSTLQPSNVHGSTSSHALPAQHMWGQYGSLVFFNCRNRWWLTPHGDPHLLLQPLQVPLGPVGG